MSGAAIGLIIVIACAAYYIVSRGARGTGVGAFRNKPTRPEDDAAE